MPPPTDYTEFSASEQKAITREAESIIEELGPFFPMIDDDLEYLKENRNKINELQATIAKSHAEIEELERQDGQKRQELSSKLYQLYDTVKLYSQDEKVIERCIRFLSLRFGQFSEKTTNIYKKVNNTEK